MKKTAHLALLRHGKSVWNLENRFTGWADVPLSDAGRREAAAAAREFAAQDWRFDAAFCSNLKRSIATLWAVLEEMDMMWLPQSSDWRLNERHYGALQGQNKSEVTQQYGEAQVRQWRRGYDTPPPPMSGAQPLLAGVAPPPSESLCDILPRVRQVYEERIAPLLSEKKNVLVVAHGNSLRALIKILENMSGDEVMRLEIATAAPRIYTL